LSGGVSRFHIITGGPGAGKTTLIDALAAQGFARTAEAGRAIIQAQVVSGGNALAGASASPSRRRCSASSWRATRQHKGRADR
jgi:predicted ATPase